MCDYIMHFYYILKLLARTDGICFVFFTGKVSKKISFLPDGSQSLWSM